MWDFDPEVSEEGWGSFVADLRSEGPRTFETCFHSASGREVPARVTASVFEYGGVEYVGAFAQDITDEKKAEEERLELERQIERAQKLESLGILAGGVAHDFNNILMAIVGHADLALGDVHKGTPSAESLEEILVGARRGARLTEQLLAYSGRRATGASDVDLSAMIREISELLRSITSKKITLRLELAEKFPVTRADEGEIQQVILNLLTNASQAIGDSPGEIVVRTSVRAGEEIDPGGWRLPPGARADHYVLLQVEDNGCGMSAETLSRIFDPFFTTKFSGRGLGLSAVLGIARRHGGGLRIRSREGEGTLFELILPARGAALSPAPQPVSPELGKMEPPLGCTLLIADDEDDVRGVLARMVRALGFESVGASNGREAIELLQANLGRIDGAIVDLTMPEMDGVKTVKALRALAPDLPVLLVSGYAQEDGLKGAAESAGVPYLQEPFRMQPLRESLSLLFESVKR